MASDRLTHLIVATALGAARLVPVVWLVPTLGGVRVPAPARVGSSVLLALVGAPLLLGATGGAPLETMGAFRMTALVGRELVVGLCLGLVASAMFRAAELAGRLGDTLRGASMAEVLVPTSDERASPLGALYLLVASVVFLHIGGVERLIEAMLSSYQVLPIAGGLSPGAATRAALVVGEASARLIAAGVGLAAPIIVAIWLTDVALGFIARAAPQVPVYFLGLPLKGLLAVGVVFVGLAALASAISGETGAFLRLLTRTIVAFSG